jgi:hypothetical protein
MTKKIRIPALVTMLALGFTLSAQTQSQNTTGADQHTTQPTDQTISMPASSDNNGMSTQQSQSTASSVNDGTGDRGWRDSQQEKDYLQQLAQFTASQTN